MRPLEILTSLILVIYFIWPLLPLRRPRWLDILPILALVVTVLHLLLEGYRWQMYPLYALVGVALILAAFRLARGDNLQSAPRNIRVLGAVSGIVLLAVALALPILFPVPALPKPSGPFAIGTHTLMLADTSRTEIYGDQPGGPRELMVQIWYPAEPQPGQQPGQWISNSDIVGRAVSTWLELPTFALDHLRYARTNSYPEAPLVEGESYPVLLFSHGWGGFRAQNTYQMEELASQGYLVAAVEHTYGSVVTVFSDGRIALHDASAMPDNVPIVEYEQDAQRLVQQWSGDLGFVLDTLEKLNTSDPEGRLTGHLDLSRVGALGHSTGGGAVVEFCAHDARCKAVLGMDTYMTPVSEDVLQNGLSQPSLFLFSELWPSENNTSQFMRLYQHLQGPALDLTILGTSHYDFTDLPLLTPLAAWIGLKGPLNGSRVMTIIKRYSVAFFNHYLRGEEAPILEGPSQEYPEVVYTSQS
jgi:predicted dienelactone hydrolase